MCYECLKLFGDKLVSDNEKTNLCNIVNNYLQKDWGKTNILKNISNNYYISQRVHSEKYAPLSRINGEEWTSIVNNGIKYYGTIIKILNKKKTWPHLNLYKIAERDGQYLDLLVTKELLHLTSALNRALTHAGGCAALVGRNGVGRRASLKIISALESAKLIVPTTNNQPFFNNDLKVVCNIA